MSVVPVVLVQYRFVRLSTRVRVTAVTNGWTLAEIAVLRPSNAVPTRTCVAPCRTAASRSPLMPAEIASAPGCAARSRAAELGQPREGGGRSACASGATAITPRRRSWEPAAHRCPPAPRALGATTPPRLGIAVEADLHEDLQRRRARPLGGVGQRLRQLGPVDRMHGVGVADDAAGLVGLQPADQMHEARLGRPAGLAPQLGDLGPGLLVAALADVGDAQSWPASRYRWPGRSWSPRSASPNADRGRPRRTHRTMRRRAPRPSAPTSSACRARRIARLGASVVRPRSERGAFRT